MKSLFLSNKYLFSSFYRVSIGIILLCSLIFNDIQISYLYNHTYSSYLNDNFFLNIIRDNLLYFQIIFCIIIILFTLGIGNFITTFVLYIFILIYLISIQFYSWGDRILTFSILYFIFVNSFKYFTFKSEKYYFPNWINQLAIISIIFNLFVIYLTNARLKWMDSTWVHGEAVLYSFNGMQFTNIPNFFLELLKNDFFAKFINYFVLIQQTLFVPLVLYKKTRLFIVIISILIHLSMIFIMGLIKFELIMILQFGFLFTDKEFEKLILRFKNINFLN